MNMSDTDMELLARYTRQHAEDAFAELVRRHLDLVHSAALRQVRAPQLAEEVAQATFIKLARHAPQFPPDTVVTAWLYQVTRREAIDVVRRESRRQLREQIATEMNAMNATAADWTHIEPLLDEAMHALDDTDRAAVLLRYFENKSLREVGATLGTSENAAQKRLGRAVERLREFFAKRGVTVGASGLVVVISANAIQAAPAGLAVTISTAAALIGPTFATTATPTLTKAIVMTTTQKSLVAAALAAAIGTGIYEMRQTATLRTQQRALLAAQKQTEAELEEALAALKLKDLRSEGVQKDFNDLMRLRNEVTQLRRENAEQKQQLVQANAKMAPVRPATASPPAEPGKYIVRDQISFAGYLTPEAAAQSTMWSMLSGNYEAITNSFSSDMLRGVLKDPLADREAFEKSVPQMASELRGIQILARKILADDRVELKMKIDSGPTEKPEVTIHPMIKVGDQWKVAGPDRTYKPEWEQVGKIETFSP